MDWHHAPLHRLADNGAYCVTGATLHKAHLFRSHLDLLLDRFFEAAKRHVWRIQAWSFFSNHYHFIGVSPDRDATSLHRLINEFHSATAREMNRIDGAAGRKVWFQFWDTHLTFPGSYLARLKYVHENPVHHGLVANAENYRWCSAGWFARNATGAFVRAVRAMKIDNVKMRDDF